MCTLRCNSGGQIFDPSNQHNDHKKWIHCFDGVLMVVFVASISEYESKDGLEEGDLPRTDHAAFTLLRASSTENDV